jgi:hypothetical protein
MESISERELIHNAAVILDTGRIVSPGSADGQVPTLREQSMTLAVYASCLARQYFPNEYATSFGDRSRS